MTTLNAREPRDSGLAIAQHHLNIRAELPEQWAHDAFSLFEHRAKKMLGLDLLILVALGELDARLNGLLSSQREFV